MSSRRAIGVLAGIVLLLGMILALTPLSVDGGTESIGCGSAYSPSYTSAEIQDIVNGGDALDRCEDKVGGRRSVAYPLAGAAALTLLFLGLTAQHKTRWDADDKPAEAA